MFHPYTCCDFTLLKSSFISKRQFENIFMGFMEHIILLSFNKAEYNRNNWINWWKQKQKWKILNISDFGDDDIWIPIDGSRGLELPSIGMFTNHSRIWIANWYQPKNKEPWKCFIEIKLFFKHYQYLDTVTSYRKDLFLSKFYCNDSSITWKNL